MVLAYPFLALLHAVYSLVVLSISFFRHLTRPDPSPLSAKRKRVPQHLAVLFVADSDFDQKTNKHCILESVQRTIQWCQQIGIPQLSVYDCDGIILSNIGAIKRTAAPECLSKEPEVDRRRIHYPPTPPLSDYAESRPLSPSEDSFIGLKSFITLNISPPRLGARRTVSNLRDFSPTHSAPADTKMVQSLALHVLTREASKPTIAATARAMARVEGRSSKSAVKNTFKLSISTLENHLEGQNGLSPPDFMIIHPVHPSKYHRSPIELHGYPPWQVRLTEIYCNRYRKQYEARLMWFLPLHVSSTLLSSSLTEWEFREALDQFAVAEMRLGK
ncbi:hypothetical protein GYMLUDRAFT_52117 [Collybiopsis luxurians FD-317 M1]|nr:hypothetical protein GYMLUDRAFT_52117 [Collybiopsis luxurians FD-317 M1]